MVYRIVPHEVGNLPKMYHQLVIAEFQPKALLIGIEVKMKKKHQNIVHECVKRTFSESSYFVRNKTCITIKLRCELQ